MKTHKARIEEINRLTEELNIVEKQISQRGDELRLADLERLSRKTAALYEAVELLRYDLSVGRISDLPSEFEADDEVKENSANPEVNEKPESEAEFPDTDTSEIFPEEDEDSFVPKAVSEFEADEDVDDEDIETEDTEKAIYNPSEISDRLEYEVETSERESFEEIHEDQEEIEEAKDTEAEVDEEEKTGKTSENQTNKAGSSVNERFGKQGKSLNESLSEKERSQALAERFRQKPIPDLKSGISVNQRLGFINELFDGNQKAYKRAISFINRCGNYSEAKFYIQTELQDKYSWKDKEASAEELMKLVYRRFL